MNKRIAINEVCDIYDGPHATPRKAQYGPVYLGINAVSENGTLNSNEFVYLSEPDYIKWTKRVVPQCGDIVFSYEATLGRYALIPKDFRCCLGRRLAVIRNRSNKINTTWLYYYFKSPEWTAFIKGNTVKGSTVDRISIEDFPSYTISLMPLPIQTQIATILSSIDKKIQLNNKINETLQEQASLLYDYWFTQFDFPDENGKPYKSSGGKMVYNEALKREIPEGWEVKPVRKLLDVVTGKEDANFSAEDGVYKFFTCSQQSLLCDKYAFDGKAILIAGNGDFNVKHYTGKFNAYQRTYILIPKDEKYFSAIYLATTRLISSFKKGSNGSIVKFITKSDVDNVNITIPNNDYYFEILNKILDTEEKNNQETQELTALRDWLLPMLMNGQATVAEEQKPIFQVIENGTKNEQRDRFALWLQNQGLAARGDIDRQTLREIFDAMDDDDK